MRKAGSPAEKELPLCSIDLRLHLRSVYVLRSPVTKTPLDSDAVKVDFQFLNCYTLSVPLRNFADIFSFTVYFPSSQAHIPNSGPEKTLPGTSSMRPARRHTRYISRTAGWRSRSSWGCPPAPSVSGWLSWICALVC